MAELPADLEAQIQAVMAQNKDREQEIARERLLRAVMKSREGQPKDDKGMFHFFTPEARAERDEARAMQAFTEGRSHEADFINSQLPPMPPEAATNLSAIFGGGAITRPPPPNDAAMIIGRLLYDALHPVSTIKNTVRNRKAMEKDDDED